MLKTIEELKVDGWKALIDSLGLAEATRFLLQYQKGSGNYSVERKKLLKNVTINEIVEPYKRNK
ncbi:MAG: hypothetical protein K9H48_15030 [Melioribacteraceae bacterium]|nr:hypothetical protein [Saprospiraceae bacterium]MCF8355764.1 hypothetical protein [Melioribacteraceae bacterium]MCF8394792.1 hypothetical protein [Melioribacteraceae bacterium]